MRIAGNAYPVYVDGIRYSSMFQAAIDIDMTYKTLFYKIKNNDGRPVKAKGMILCSEEWTINNPKEWEELKKKL